MAVPHTGQCTVGGPPCQHILLVTRTRRSRNTPTVHSETRLLLADLLDKAASSGMVCFWSEFEECTTVAIHTVWEQCGCSGFCAPFCMFALHFCTASCITSTATLVHVVLRRRRPEEDCVLGHGQESRMCYFYEYPNHVRAA